MAGPDSNPVEPSGVEVAPGVLLPESELRFSATHASGPGGQNVNKVATKIRLHVSLGALAPHLDEGAQRRLAALAGSRLTREGDLVFMSQTSRSAITNRRECLDRLRELIIAAMRRPRKRKRTRVSAGAKRKRLESKRKRGDVKRMRGRPTND